MLRSKINPGHLLLLVGIALRFIYTFYIHPLDHSIYSDMANYLRLADLMMEEKWEKGHFFQPIGFPLIIYFLKKISSDWMQWLTILHLLTASGTLWLVWKISSKSFGKKVGFISLLLATFHVPWIIFSGMILAENFFIFSLALLAFWTQKLLNRTNMKNALLWALIFFTAFLLKGTHIFFAPLMLITLFIYKKRTALLPILVIGSTIFSGMLLHGLFTYQRVGQFQMSASAGGLNFVEGKCLTKDNTDSAGYRWHSPLYFQLGINEAKKWDRPFTDSSYFMKEGLNCIKKNPLVLVQSLESIPFLFMGNTMWPSSHMHFSEWTRLYELYFAFFLITGFICFINFSRAGFQGQEFIIWLCPVMALFICVYIFKSEIRFRVPFDVWFIPLATKGCYDLIRSKT
jgi:hypothetical protein